MNNDRIIIAGFIRDGKHQQDQIISSEGICKCITCGSHLNAQWMTLKWKRFIMKEYQICEKVGDRGKDESYSLKPFAFCPNANPMSDRNQFILEKVYYGKDNLAR